MLDEEPVGRGDDTEHLDVTGPRRSTAAGSQRRPPHQLEAPQGWHQVEEGIVGEQVLVSFEVDEAAGEGRAQPVDAGGVPVLSRSWFVMPRPYEGSRAPTSTEVAIFGSAAWFV